MNLVDSCGWLEYFAGGPNAGFFAPPIEKEENLLVPTICILEVFKNIAKQQGHDAAIDVIAPMLKGHVVGLDTSIAINAAWLSVDIGLPMADSVILATAHANHAVIWTQDKDFKGIEGVKYIEK